MLDNGKITARRRRLQSQAVDFDPHGWRRFKDGPITVRCKLHQRGVLALRLKPIFEARAKANLIASGENFGKGSPKSDEPITPIRTDVAVAAAANLGKDTIRRVKPEIATRTLLKTGVTGVTGVQPNTGAAFAVTRPEVSGVTGVTPP